MLNFKDFTDEFISRCSSCLDAAGVSLDINVRPVSKPQAGELTGLVFKSSGSVCAPAIYAEELYESYMRGRSVAELALETAGIAMHHIESPPEFSAEDFSLSEESSNLSVRLLGADRNTRLSDHLARLDLKNGLILTADIVRGEFRAPVSLAMLEQSDISSDRLFEKALECAARGGAMLRPLTEAVFEGPGGADILGGDELQHIPDESGCCSAYVLTNNEALFGAAALYYPGVIERLSGMLGNFYILPSSIHELIIIPASEDPDTDALTAMIRDANNSVVADSDILSDDLYLCEGGFVKRMKKEYGLSSCEPVRSFLCCEDTSQRSAAYRMA